MKLILLSAERGAGKTTACLRLIALAQEADLTAGGILAPARYDAAGAKVGIDVRDLATGATRPLADVEHDPARATVGQYRFDAASADWALARLLDAVAQPLDLLIVDEIGPLELFQGGGYAPVLARLPASPARAAIILVRVSLAETLAERLAPLAPVTVSLSLANRDAAPAELLRMIAAER